MQASVPDPSMRNISTEGKQSEIFFASLYSHSEKRPVDGPQVFRRSMTASRTTGSFEPRTVGPPACRRS